MLGTLGLVFGINITATIVGAVQRTQANEMNRMHETNDEARFTGFYVYFKLLHRRPLLRDW